MAKVQTFGDRVREQRQRAEMTQAEVAERMGVQASYVAHIEGDRREPSLGNFRKLVAALGCDPKKLLGDA